VECLRKCKQETPSEVEAWHRRIDKALALETAKAEGRMPVANAAADPILANRSEQLYRRLRRIIEVLRPSRFGKGLIAMLTLMMFGFGLEKISDNFTVLGQLSLSQLTHGEYYRTITYQFLHGNYAHLLLNSFALILFARPVEHVYGTARFLIIFIISGILSGIAQVALIPDDFVIGASGAILGVFGAAIAAIIKLKDVLPATIRKQELRWMGSIAVLQVIFDQVVNFIAGITDKSEHGVRIGALAHLGGMLFGFILGMILPLKKFSDENR
jgi:membrane associated rhomboid family serine protease